MILGSTDARAFPPCLVPRHSTLPCLSDTDHQVSGSLVMDLGKKPMCILTRLLRAHAGAQERQHSKKSICRSVPAGRRAKVFKGQGGVGVFPQHMTLQWALVPDSVQTGASVLFAHSTFKMLVLLTSVTQGRSHISGRALLWACLQIEAVPNRAVKSL